MSDGAARVLLLALDVDGVLTDGSITLDQEGRELKRFAAADGVGLRTWSMLGFSAAVVTGRVSDAILHRMAELGVAEVIQGSKDKSAGLDELVRRARVDPSQIAFVGDDWPDLPILRRVGYPMSVANADPAVKAVARFVTHRTGGHGAVREAVEHLLAAKGLLDRARRLYDVGDGLDTTQRSERP